MGFFNFLKSKSPEQKRTEQFERIKSKIIIREKNSVMHDMILTSPHDDSYGDVNPNGTGRFGLDKSNPIPIYGIDNINAYMDKLRYKFTSKISGNTLYNPISFLRTYDGDDAPIGAKKSESGNMASGIESSNIEGTIDVYNIYSIGNTKLSKIYINSYSLKTSGKVPDGFYHRDEIPVLQDGRVALELVSNTK